jgi:hypothetical protein
MKMHTNLLVARTLPAGRREPLRIAGAALALTLALSTLPLRAFAGPTVAINPVGVTVPPLVPIGDRITAFSKDAVGETSQAQVIVRTCQNEISEQINHLAFRMKISPGPCDEGFSREVLNGYLIGSVDIVRRKSDLRGCFAGTWQIISFSNVLLAQGDLSGTVGCGTHRAPGTAPFEDCHEPRHYEGKFAGHVVMQGPYYGADICATLAGTGPLQPNTQQLMSIEGAMFSRCPQ